MDRAAKRSVLGESKMGTGAIVIVGVGFKDPAQMDFRLAAGSVLIGLADDPGIANGVASRIRRVSRISFLPS